MSINAGVIQLYGGDNDPTHMYRMVEAYAATLDNGTGKHTTSYDLDRVKLESLWAAINRFALKVGRGRYTYRLTGGKLGWLMSRPGQRGVNCADFVVKVLKEAGISTISNGLVNTPHRIAAGG